METYYPVLILIALYSVTTEALQCFKCTVLPPSPYSNETTRLCSTFDYSDKYIIECPYSTLCMKKEFSVLLNKVQINGTIRDCAQQRYDFQYYNNGQWQMKATIEEPYLEGCRMENDKGQRLSTTQFCYCRGDLCNSSTSFTASKVLLFGISFIAILLKTSYSIL